MNYTITVKSRSHGEDKARTPPPAEGGSALAKKLEESAFGVFVSYGREFKDHFARSLPPSAGTECLWGLSPWRYLKGRISGLLQILGDLCVCPAHTPPPVLQA